ncbi:hypothetical protein Saa2_06602 [Streptomyces acidiscabies]|nr:hypothetical protein Saa2_06602 [Streptomyces acidiscabies]
MGRPASRLNAGSGAPPSWVSRRWGRVAGRGVGGTARWPRSWLLRERALRPVTVLRREQLLIHPVQRQPQRAHGHSRLPGGRSRRSSRTRPIPCATAASPGSRPLRLARPCRSRTLCRGFTPPGTSPGGECRADPAGPQPHAPRELRQSGGGVVSGSRRGLTPRELPRDDARSADKRGALKPGAPPGEEPLPAGTTRRRPTRPPPPATVPAPAAPSPSPPAIPSPPPPLPPRHRQPSPHHPNPCLPVTVPSTANNC